MNKKATEMTMNTVVVIVLALVLISVGLYIVYTKILKPADSTDSLMTCQSRGGTVVSSKSDCSSGIYLTLTDETTKTSKPCCIPIT